MTFSPKQKAVIDKAISNGYLSHLMSPELIAWLSTVEPKTPEDASIMVGAFMAVAYERGDGIEQIYDATLRRSAVAFRAEELGRMMIEYVGGRECPICHGLMGKLDHGICSVCNQELSGQNAPRRLTTLLETQE